MKKYIFLILIIVLVGCKVYSFSGANIPQGVETINIEFIPNKSVNSWSSLENIFNQTLRNKILNDASVKLKNESADYNISGSIIGYNISPQSPTTGGFSNSYKLEITVLINFEDTKTEKKVQWTENFSNFEIYEGSISGNEDAFITKISENISNNIFNKIFSTW